MEVDCTIPLETVQARLQELEPELPWHNQYRFSKTLQTIPSTNERLYAKSENILHFAESLVTTASYLVKGRSVQGLKVLDLASAEGAHSMTFARAGARSVLGIEGRELSVRRAAFAAEAFGVSNVIFRQGDVRKVSAKEVGTFDLVLCLGILYHLTAEDFRPMLKSLYELTADTMILYTHVGCDEAVRMLDAKGPSTMSNGLEGYTKVEHLESDSEEVRLKRSRGSLDNTISFWPTEETLYKELEAAGFKAIHKIAHPNPVSRPPYPGFRVLLGCLK